MPAMASATAARPSALRPREDQGQGGVEGPHVDGVSALVGSRDALGQEDVGLLEPALQRGPRREGAQCAGPHHLVADVLGVAGQLAGRVHQRRDTAAEEGDPGQLVTGQQRSPLVPRFLEETLGVPAHPVGLVELAGPPAEEGGQPELDGGAPGRPSEPGEGLVHGPQRRNPEDGVDVGPVVDDPLRLPGEGVDDVGPSRVAGREQLHQGTEDGERFPVGPGLFGGTDRLPQHADGLVVTGVGRGHEVGGGLPQPSGGEELPGDVAVQATAAPGADALVDSLRHHGMGELVGELVTPLLLGDAPELHQPVEGVGQIVGLLTGEADQGAGVHPPAEDGQQLQRPLGGGVEVAEAARHPLGEPFGQPAQHRSGEIRPLLDQGPQESDGVQGIAPGALLDPFHEDGCRPFPGHPFGQTGQRAGVERLERHPPQQVVLFKAGQDRGRFPPLGQLGRTGGGHDQHPVTGTAVGQIVQQLERRGVGQVEVVEEHDHRMLPGQVREHHRERFQQPAPGRFVARPRPCPRHGPDAAEQATQVIRSPGAGPLDLVGFEASQVPLQRLRPQPEGGRGPERIGPGRQADDVGAAAGRQLGGESGLAHAGLTHQQRTAELTGGRPLQLALQRSQLPLAANELRPPRRDRRGARTGRRRTLGRSGGADSAGRQSTVTAASGVGSPFKRSRPAGRNRNPPREPTSPATSSLVRIWPPSASLHRRLASTTASPWKSAPSRTGSPAWSPTRKPSVGPEPDALCSSMPRCMETAHLSASTPLEKATISPSPRLFTSAPPLSATARRRTAKWAWRTSSAASSPSRANSSVDATRSVNSNVTTDEAPSLTPTVCLPTSRRTPPKRYAP